MTATGDESRLLMIGCGILKDEITLLIREQGWPVTFVSLPSALHMDFHKLGHSLGKALAREADREKVVFYGACHPLMDGILAEAGTIRTPGQNCLDIYLGRELFDRELENGAFFLFEDWALHWDEVAGELFRTNPAVTKTIFTGAHKYLLAIRTPCSGDFTLQAEEISRQTGLELRWLYAGLDHLEANMATVINRKL